MALVVFPNRSSKEEVLLKLWEYAKVSKSNSKYKKLTIERCRQLNTIKSFGHVAGRLLNVSFKHFPAIVQIKYDSVNGQGKMQEVADFFNQKYRAKNMKSLDIMSNNFRNFPPKQNEIVEPTPLRDRTRTLEESDFEIINLVA